jgi:two-component system, chemotaxis family, protein-glutamate methylesterase/glutaminase
MNDEIKDPPMPSDASPDAVFKVVVVGASAGGIPALSHILPALPSDFGAAIAVVQHRDPTRRGMLAQVLGCSCPFPVRDAEGGEPLRPGIVFLAPPDRHLTAGPGGILSLDQSERIHFTRPSAERLFISAAENLKSRVIAVVLSGAGHDGESGVQVIKRMGGTVIAQDEETSEQFGMPQAAINSGAVDYVLPLAGIAPALVRLVKNSGLMLEGDK